MLCRSFYRSLALGAALLALPLSTRAQAPNPDPSAVQSGAYKIESHHTRILFSVNHMGFTTWYGDFTGAAGTLVLDAKAPSLSRLDLTIPVASVSTTNQTLDAELKGPQWLDAEKFPTISFHATKIVQTGPRTADVVGDLTFHGVTRPVELEAKFNASGVNMLDKAYTIGFEVSGQLKRSDFGVKTYVPLIGDDVNLIISAAFEKSAQ